MVWYQMLMACVWFSGPVVMDVSGYSEKGFKRKLAVQALFGKVFYLSEVSCWGFVGSTFAWLLYCLLLLMHNFYPLVWYPFFLSFLLGCMKFLLLCWIENCIWYLIDWLIYFFCPFSSRSFQTNSQQLNLPQAVLLLQIIQISKCCVLAWKAWPTSWTVICLLKTLSRDGFWFLYLECVYVSTSKAQTPWIIFHYEANYMSDSHARLVYCYTLNFAYDCHGQLHTFSFCYFLFGFLFIFIYFLLICDSFLHLMPLNWLFFCLTFWASCRSSVQETAPWLSRKFLGLQSMRLSFM